MLRNMSMALWLGLAACGSAQYIQRTQTGGTIELDGDRNKAMEQANQMMAQHCGPNNFQIVQEGLEPVGTDTYTTQDTAESDRTSRNGRRNSSDQQTQQVTSTRTATAWRVHYQCGMPAAAGMAPGPGMAPPPGPPPGGDVPPSAPPPAQ